MLTSVKAYSSWRSAPTLLLDPIGRPETDLLQIRDINGLEPVKATVNTTPFGSIDGADHAGSTIAGRNIVLTVATNPDWNIWTHESLRRLVYAYFIPKRLTRLVFESDELIPLEIYGIVESVTPNMFSKDPEIIVSIICPDPHFTALEPVIVTGVSGVEEIIDYNGDVEAGIYIKVLSSGAPDPSAIAIQVGEEGASYFSVAAGVSASMYFELSSVPRKKFVQNVDTGSGVITSRLSMVSEGFIWPTLQPGENEFSVFTNAGTQDWELTYYERYGGL